MKYGNYPLSLKILSYSFVLPLLTLSQESTKCRERERPISTDNGDLYTLIDATLHQKLTLECHYCNENDDSQPRNWHKVDKLGLSQPREVQLDMENEMGLNRISVNIEHSLIINNFSEADTGLYYCLGFQQQNTDEKFNYLVDLVYDVNTTGISNLTKVVPDFIQHEKCEGTCNPDAEGVNRGWKVGKAKGFKYRKTFVLPEKSYLTLVCPESSLDNIVIWKKRGKVIKAGDASNPNLIVDTFNTLYLVDVTEAEAGNYTCQVDDIKMQQVVVFVYSKARLLTHKLVRHFMYLGFILSLTGTCYCAGLIITCHRRKTFKSYEELVREHPEDIDEMENLL